MIAAGSPGVSRSSRKTKTATTSRTGTVAASRRAMKLISQESVKRPEWSSRALVVVKGLSGRQGPEWSSRA
jgi:hypothetical protein